MFFALISAVQEHLLPSQFVQLSVPKSPVTQKIRNDKNLPYAETENRILSNFQQSISLMFTYGEAKK